MEGEEYEDKGGINAGASFRDLDIDGGEPGSLMRIANGMQDVRQGIRGSFPCRDGPPFGGLFLQR